MILFPICLFVSAVVWANLFVGHYATNFLSTFHLAWADYSESVPLHNPALAGSVTPMFNFAQEKSQVKMFNFWSGKE